MSAYARENYQRLASIADDLDDKADGIIKYLGAFSGIAAIVGAYGAVAVDWRIAVSALPPVALAVIATCVAVRARIPMGVPAPPAGGYAILYAETFGGAAETAFMPQVVAAGRGMAAVVDEKRRLVRVATALFVWALVCLIIPLLTAITLALTNSAAPTLLAP